MGRILRIEASAWLLAALAILILPAEWLLSVWIAVGSHELGHYVCARLLGIPVFRISVSGGGCRMETAPMTRMQELFCAAAGPAASLLLFCLVRRFPVLGFCGLVQGLFNLLPVYPMDGGRILRSLAGERTSKIVSGITALSLAGMGLMMSFLQNMGPLPAFFGLILLSKQNIACKSGKLTVK